MKAAVFVGQGRLAARDWPRPRVGPGELLLRVRGCGLCGSDIAKIEDPATLYPAVFGHELVGDVVEAGEGVADFGVRDRVVAAHHVPCGECHYCARGSHSMCRAFKASCLDRVALARELGADVAGAADEVAAALRARSDGRGADQVFVTGGGAGVLPWAASLARDGGQVHFFAGGEDGTLPVELAALYRRELTLTATYSSSPATLGRAFWLLAAGKVEVERLFTHRLSLERLGEGVELMRRREALKVYVTP